MVGGISALVGAAILGPRIGKFTKDKNGKITKVNAIPGHNITIGALGVFILWLGWYGFNGAAAKSVEQLGSIFVTTTIAPALATVSCVFFPLILTTAPIPQLSCSNCCRYKPCSLIMIDLFPFYMWQPPAPVL